MDSLTVAHGVKERLQGTAAVRGLCCDWSTTSEELAIHHYVDQATDHSVSYVHVAVATPASCSHPAGLLLLVSLLPETAGLQPGASATAEARAVANGLSTGSAVAQRGPARWQPAACRLPVAQLVHAVSTQGRHIAAGTDCVHSPL